MATFTGTIYDRQMAWLAEKGFGTGTREDRFFAYFQDLLGIECEDLDAYILTACQAQGFTGTLFDVYTGLMADQTSVEGTIADLELTFYGDSTYSFGSTTPSYLLLETGDKILQESGDALLV